MAQPTLTSVRKAGILAAGMQAPEFKLPTSFKESVTSKELFRQTAILLFYPADWSPVCGGELALYSELVPEFGLYNARVVGISVDSVWSHVEYKKQRALHFDLLSDFHPHGEVSRKFGAYREEDGTSERAIFLVDARGVIRWSYLSPVEENPGADGVLIALENMRTQEEKGGGQRAA